MEEESKSTAPVDAGVNVQTDEEQGAHVVVAQVEGTAQEKSGESDGIPDGAEGGVPSAQTQSAGSSDDGARGEGEKRDAQASVAPEPADSSSKEEKSEPLPEGQAGIDIAKSEQQALSDVVVTDQTAVKENEDERDVAKGDAVAPIDTEDIEVLEKKGEKVAEAEGVEGEQTDDEEEVEVEVATHREVGDDTSSQEKKEDKDGAVTGEAGALDQGEEKPSQEGRDAGGGGEKEAAEAVSTGAEQEKGSNEEGLSWKGEFFASFQKQIHNKWLVRGAGVFLVLLLTAVIFLVPYISINDSDGVHSLESITGPVCGMKFFLPFTESSGKTRFIKVTVAFELMDEGLRKEIERKTSEVRKEIIDMVLAKSLKEVKSSNGKEILKRKSPQASMNV